MKMLKQQIVGAFVGSMMVFNMLLPVVSAQALGERVIKHGAAGDDVKQVQSSLHNMGYTIDTIDGVYGTKTHQAVVNFQAKIGIKPDGIVGHETIKALQKDGQPAAAPKNTQTTATAAPQEYSKVHKIVATAYAPGHEDNGPWGNLTHIGTQVRPGIIAVDPKLIPLGSKVYIEFADGRGVYAVAEDTGGAIKGNRIDIAFWTREEAKKFGIQNVKVYVVNEGKTRSH